MTNPKIGDLIKYIKKDGSLDIYGVVCDIEGNSFYCCWEKTIKEAKQIYKRFKNDDVSRKFYIRHQQLNNDETETYYKILENKITNWRKELQ